ncbi:MAG: hypothetical protein JNM94_11860 [Phycisphaerae bacterium]|nr:hypothetical protein [Phycisphaerae bacterium]
MSLLTDLFVAKESSASGYGPDSAARFDRAQLGGLTNLEFETLWAILLGQEWDVETHALREVVAGDESWIHQFPPSYVAKLLTLGTAEMTSASKKWAATEEVSATPEEMSPVIDALVRLARSAHSKGEGLFLWTSL